jgi:hypothetical protein
MFSLLTKLLETVTAFSLPIPYKSCNSYIVPISCGPKIVMVTVTWLHRYSCLKSLAVSVSLLQADY